MRRGCTFGSPPHHTLKLHQNGAKREGGRTFRSPCLLSRQREGGVGYTKGKSATPHHHPEGSHTSEASRGARAELAAIRLVQRSPCHTHSSHTHCRPLRYKHKRVRTWAEVHSEWEIYRARLRSLECREPALTFAPDVKRAIGIDITQHKGARYKPFDDLLDGILCAYLGYYFWHWGGEGYWVVGNVGSGYIVLPRCRLPRCSLMECLAEASSGPTIPQGVDTGL